MADDQKIIPTSYTLQSLQKPQSPSGGGGYGSSRAAPMAGASGGLGNLGGGVSIGSVPGGRTGLRFDQGNTRFGVGVGHGGIGAGIGAKFKEGGKVKAKKMAKGGSVSSASKRADGCATKGKTKGKFV